MFQLRVSTSRSAGLENRENGKSIVEHLRLSRSHRPSRGQPPASHMTPRLELWRSFPIVHRNLETFAFAQFRVIFGLPERVAQRQVVERHVYRSIRLNLVIVVFITNDTSIDCRYCVSRALALKLDRSFYSSRYQFSKRGSVELLVKTIVDAAAFEARSSRAEK